MMASESIADAEIELPLVKLTKEDVYGALFVHSNSAKETFKDILLKLQTWVVNFAEEQVRPLRESGCFTDDEIEGIRRKACVISPITLTLYIQWVQMEYFLKLPDSAKERYLLEKMPDRFKARFRGNASSRNARELLPDEEMGSSKDEDSKEARNRILKMSFAEFVKEMGEEIRKEVNNG